ncbi:alpha/beta hydrolase [Burkholderia sp. Ac-20353]|uniref:alpha/beta hydrolase n=1 Tax=Burkholderia sp. Ac-20353 TaxID=2703894 RepID=UPI00197B8C2A|nr:alpha/beta hydrolase [Burkholderia sp. Ac-20353]MBN3789752.1 alpha/beta hydrolase [Burkholderia sp. Ac-20353]
MIEQIEDIDVQDVVYLKHDDVELLARVYTPAGEGPFPAVIELHGGAWSKFDRTRGKAVHETLARSGLVVVSLDFRQGAQGAYPKSPSDINYGIRWLKANAARFNVDAERIGLSGNSSGGHLGMLVAMRPHDAQYASIPLPPGSPDVDATVSCISMLWPVINPYGRYHYAKRLLAEGNAPDWAAEVIGLHDAYWNTEANMKEGSPTLILERGEAVNLPRALWVLATDDDVHNYHDIESEVPGTEADRFMQRYREAGGEIELAVYEAPMMFTTMHPTLPASVAAMQRVVDFAHQNLSK